MSMFKIDGNISIDTSNVFIDGHQTDLSICSLCTEDYEKLVLENKCLSNMLYIVSSEYSNAYGQQIKNVAYPTDHNDAATKQYVDEAISSCISSLTRNDMIQIAKDVFKNGIQNILSSL